MMKYKTPIETNFSFSFFNLTGWRNDDMIYISCLIACVMKVFLYINYKDLLACEPRYQ